jgi:ribonucleoside-diphosphate reductase alpha chain
MTQNTEIPFAKSMPDYIMRWLASRFLGVDVQEELGILTPEVRARKASQEALMRGDTAGPVADGGNGSAGNGGASNGGTKAHASGPATSGDTLPSPPAPGSRPASDSQPATTKAAAEAFTDTPPVMPARLHGLDLGPACAACGGMMQRTGSCYTCSSCGNNTGCG